MDCHFMLYEMWADVLRTTHDVLIQQKNVLTMVYNM
jgi:hypothetical protein